MKPIATSAARKVLLAALSLSCIVASGTSSNDAEACPPPRAPASPPQIVIVLTLPAKLPPIPTPANLPPLQVPWIVRQAPTPPAPQPPSPQADGWPADWARVEDQVLVLTNQRRAQGAVCGDRAYAPAPPLVMSAALRRAAREHSDDMGRRNYFDHTSPDGRTPGDRAKADGSSSAYVGENIFAGPHTAEETVDGWMSSPGHCENIMNPHYTSVGVGYADVGGSRFAHYWTQDFGG